MNPLDFDGIIWLVHSSLPAVEAAKQLDPREFLLDQGVLRQRRQLFVGVEFFVTALFVVGERTSITSTASVLECWVSSLGPHVTNRSG